VSPGFEFEDFKLADRRVLSEQFPQHKELIEMLTRM
jgi:predicted cupin superfamily sugar epimerase